MVALISSLVRQAREDMSEQLFPPPYHVAVVCVKTADAEVFDCAGCVRTLGNYILRTAESLMLWEGVRRATVLWEG